MKGTIQGFKIEKRNKKGGDEERIKGTRYTVGSFVLVSHIF